MSGIHKINFIDKANINSLFFCSICNVVLNSEEDFRHSEKYQCCNSCYLDFIECRKDILHKEWKPNKTIVKEYINIRNKLFAQHRSNKKCL